MIRREGERLVLAGAVTLANVGALLEEGRRHVAEGASTVDLGEVSEMDSALLALLLAWVREAAARGPERGGTLTFANPPESLRTIARLYGVDGLLPLAP
jgi:phospholipid transport system transporter-binding protein